MSLPDPARLLAPAEECAEETIHACREEASRIRQCRIWPEYARWLEQNATAAERWLVKQGALRASAEASDGE